MLRKRGPKPSRDIIKELSRNNTMLQAVVTKTKEEVSCLREENRTSNRSIDLSIGGSSTDRRESWIRRRGPLMRPREDYTETASEEEGVEEERGIREKCYVYLKRSFLS